ncbi:MAG: helicase HerA domain-containing protein [Saccharofermentanales bacterium]|jgi:hypothetical protein
MNDFEKLGVFYLGRKYDLENGKQGEGLLLYDSKDLTTHGVCVGMTGSGKTGLCIGLLEEAAMDNIPAIIIDPKGDMANLLLSFPDLSPDDFLPWINHDDARKKNLEPEAYAAQQAELWQKGLAAWGQDGERIRTMRQNADFVIYTPGSTAGVPVSILKSFAVPPAEVIADPELLREQVSGTASSLLGLIGVDADPIKSREHILLSNIILEQWQLGRDLQLADLITLIQQPAFTTVGVMPLDSFFPPKDRLSLALLFNNLLASPGFAAWLAGEPLDIDQILYSPAGKPKISIFSIAHLSDPERMFFVSLLLNQVLAWTRTQSGTSSLRAILYMDEIFGYFPPVANPPSKAPLLTLLKQARAYGLGIMLTTQNPVDLDYKGLANTGTWFIGRLQTERDKQRVLEGLEGASATQGVAFNRGRMEQILAGLGNRVFLMHNVHESEPALFETRWCMSYLRGPLTRTQIQKLQPGSHSGADTQPAANATIEASTRITTAPVAQLTENPTTPTTSVAPVTTTVEQAAAISPAAAGGQPPVLPHEIRQCYMPLRSRGTAGDSLIYRPMVLADVEIGFRNAKAGVQQVDSRTFVSEIMDSVYPVDWNTSTLIEMAVTDMDSSGAPNATFSPLPPAAAAAKNYTTWNRDLVNWIYQTQQLVLQQSPKMKITSMPDESERDFRIRLSQETHEARDAEIETLRQKYAKQVQSLEEKIRKAEQAVEREKDQANQQKMQTAISLGATIFSSFLGKKKVSATSLGRATTAVRGASRAVKESGDVNRSKETVEAYKAQLQELTERFEADSEQLAEKLDAANTELIELVIRPTKSDIRVKALVLVWMPYFQKTDGTVESAWS